MQLMTYETGPILEPLALLNCGVPQGFIFGPILFLVYINDFNYASRLLRTVRFADDMNLFLSGKSLVEIEKLLNNELLIIDEWFKANLLLLNMSKTSYIVFGNRKKYENLISIWKLSWLSARRANLCVRKRKVRLSSRPADSKKFPSVRN